MLACAIHTPLLPLLVRATHAATCVDPDELSSAEIGMRDALDYTDNAPDASKASKHCKHYDADCGSCQLLNGTVTATGHCTSWTKRAG